MKILVLVLDCGKRKKVILYSIIFTIIEFFFLFLLQGEDLGLG